MDGLMIFLAQDVYLLVLGLAAALLLLRYRAHWRTWAGAAVGIGVPAFLLAQLGTRLIADPRPFLSGAGPALIPSATDNGFPSDHTLLLATAAAVVTVVDRRAGAGFWGLALLVGLARVYVRVHHLLDVGGSLVIVGLALAGYSALRRWWPRSVALSRAPANDAPPEGAS